MSTKSDTINVLSSQRNPINKQHETDINQWPQNHTWLMFPLQLENPIKK